MSEREVARVVRDGRAYHLVCNRYPVTPRHFLPVRSSHEPAETLPQHLHGMHELEDLLILLAMAGPPYRGYFNSNRGADNSQSGSSVNHFHFQLFPHNPPGDSPLSLATPRTSRVEQGLRWRSIAGWPAHHVLVDGTVEAIASMAGAIWHRVAELNDANIAYNVEAVAGPDNHLRVFLFARRPARQEEVPGAGSLSPNFGGWELTGDLVVPSREILAWIKSHPADARALMERRLREGTRPLDTTRG